MSIRCIGCDSPVNWDGTSAFAYTCSCGGHILYNDVTGYVHLPVSLIKAIQDRIPPPHLDYLVGNSLHSSKMKDTAVQSLKLLGAIWMVDCEECKKNGAYLRTIERAKYLAVQDIEHMLHHKQD